MKNRERIAVITGANRGIGLEICRQLAKEDFQVILTSRDAQKGQEACAHINQGNCGALFHPLDVVDANSIKRLAEDIERIHGRCDILVNNAGIFPDSKSTKDDGWPSVFDAPIDLMRMAMETNVYGPMLLCCAFVPMMKKHNFGRIVNLSSGMGQLTDMNGGCPAYRVSKTALNALTRIVSEELKGYNILVNSMCPGWVKTDMGGPGAIRELPEGADTALWLATLPDGGPTGKFFRDRKEIPW